MDKGVNVGLVVFLTLAAPGLAFMLAGILILTLETGKEPLHSYDNRYCGPIQFVNGTPSLWRPTQWAASPMKKKRRFRGVVEVRTGISPKDLTGRNQSC